jgi:serine/threonine protein kinase
MTPRTAIFAGRYRLIAPIGGGTPSTTFVAVDEQSGIDVVLKRFAVRDALGWKQVDLAEREAQVLRGLDHELLPRYLDHFEQAGALFTVMTRLPGEDLRAARQRGLRLTSREAFMLLLDVSSIFDYLHGQLPPIIHRDIKPSNVLICPDGRFRVVDFGSVARALQADGTTVVGTFGYMAPEQFQGRAGPASDIYGLGATILTTLTGVEPERQPHVGLAIDVHQALGVSVDPRLRHVLQGMLQPDPDERPSSLGQWLASSVDLPVASAPAPNQPVRVAPPSWALREDEIGIFIVTFMVALLAVLVGMLWLPNLPWGLLMWGPAPALVAALRLWRRLFKRQLPASAVPGGTQHALDDRARRSLPPGPGA